MNNYTKTKSIILDISDCSRALTIQKLRIYSFLQQYSIKFSDLINSNTKDIYKKSKTRRVLQSDSIEYSVFVDFSKDSKLFFDFVLTEILSKTIFFYRSTKELDTLLWLLFLSLFFFYRRLVLQISVISVSFNLLLKQLCLSILLNKRS